MTTALVIAAALIFIAGLFAVIVERTEERDEARTEVERLARVDDENTRLDADNMRMACRLAELELLAGNTPPALSIVPASREVSDYSWPAIARVLEIEDEA